MTPGAPTIIGRANGATMKALSANLPKFEASKVVRAEIKTPKDLKGKRVGIQEPGGFADLLSRSVLRAARIDPKDVNFVSIASEDVPALVANQVDTAILNVEQEMFAKSKVPDLHAIGRMWELQPKTLYTFLSATEKTIAANPAMIQAVIIADIEATRQPLIGRPERPTWNLVGPRALSGHGHPHQSRAKRRKAQGKRRPDRG